MLQFYTPTPAKQAFLASGRQANLQSIGSLFPLRLTFNRLNRRFLLVITCLFSLAVQANATDIYLAQSASGSADGSSWDNAKAGAAYLNSLSGTTLPSETHIYIKAGNYTYTGTALIRMGFNNTIQGGYPASATGTDKSGYNPIANQTNVTLNQSTAGYRYFLTTSGPGTGTGMDANSTIVLQGLRFFGQQVSSYNDGIFNAGNGSGHGSSPGTFKGIDLYVEGYQGGASAFQFNGNVGGIGAVYFTNSLFNNNSAASMGGAIYMNSNTNATLYIDKCSFTGNENLGPLSVAAGAIHSFSPVNITDSYFCNNKAAYAGGALGNQATGGAPMSWNISNTVFYNNQATNAAGQGGAIFAGQGSLILNGCSFYNNSAGSHGGAIYKGQTTFNYPTASITNCTFYENGCRTATNFGADQRGGGAIYYHIPNANFSITSTKFINNYSQPGGSNTFGSGGAIKLGNSGTAGSYKMTLDNCLFSGNYFGASSSASTTTTWGADFAATVKNSSGQAIFDVKSTTKVQLASAAAYTADPAYASFPGSAPYTFEAGVMYSNTDNGGVGPFTGNCPTSINAVAVNVTGQVWDDVNGNVTLDAGENGTNAGGPLFVNLVDANGTVIASTTVSASGSYTLTAPVSTSGLKLVLTNSATSTTPGSLPAQWVNTGESVGPGNSATQSATLGFIELNTGTTDATAQNFGIEHLPTPGSGSNTVPNPGGSSPVTVPANTFTNLTPSNDNGDAPPGSVTAIHLTSFPTNVTSLTIDGSVYTSLPAGGITIPTDASGAPTVPVLVDPANDSQPVVFTYSAIDNAGQASTTTGSATLNFTAVPDLTPVIFARPSTVYNTTNLTLVVDVVELLGVATNGLITVRVTKDPLINLVFPSTATTVGGRTVQNNVWSVDNSNPSYYILTTSQVIGAGDKLSFGFTGQLSPGATTGVLTISSVIVGGSGGEVRVNNNVDADKIDYFQQ